MQFEDSDEASDASVAEEDEETGALRAERRLREIEQQDDERFEEDEQSTGVSRCRRRCCRCLAFLWFSASIGMVAFLYRLSLETTYVAEHLARPTIQEAVDRERCLFNEACNICDQPIRMSLLPACESLALVAPDGVGAVDVRRTLESASRLTTGSDKCVISNELRVGASYGVHPDLAGECTDKIFMHHHVAQKFALVSKIKDVPGYSPRFRMYVWRDPAHAALTAFNYYMHCRSQLPVQCKRDFPKPEEVNSVEWFLFAMDYFTMLRGHYNSSVDDAGGIVVHYEHLCTLDALATALRYVARTRVLPRVERMMACVHPYAVAAAEPELLYAAYASGDNARVGAALTATFADLRARHAWWTVTGSG